MISKECIDDNFLHDSGKSTFVVIDIWPWEFELEELFYFENIILFVFAFSLINEMYFGMP